MPQFDHEKLKVYQASIRFVAWETSCLAERDIKGPARDQLDRAAMSISLNIAEGNGKSLKRDRCRFFEIARGSALECAACLDILGARGQLGEKEIEAGKDLLFEIVSMLHGLIRAVMDRVREETAGYGIAPEHGEAGSGEREQE